MDVRLVQLLGSFIAARSEYALARLECAMHAPEAPAPPLISRLSAPSEAALHADWPQIEEQLELALRYAKRMERSDPRAYRNDGAYRALDRAIREMDQYARAVRWVLTVTHNEDAQ